MSSPPSGQVPQPRLIAASLVIFGAIGLLRIGLIIGVSRPEPEIAGRIVVATMVIVSFWVPVTWFVSALSAARISRRWMVVIHLTAIGIVAFVEPAWAGAALRAVGSPIGRYAERLFLRLDTNLLFYISILAGVWAANHYTRQARSRVDAANLDAAVADAQLEVLTLQLQPHFLFNTLNLISQLAYDRPHAAQDTLANLRALFVHSLRNAFRREVPLREELGFLDAYLQIQRDRFRERLRVTVDASPELLDAAVPHLLLQPLVENAIVHGIAKRAEGGRVEISAEHARGRLILTIRDDGLGINAPLTSTGIGLTNTRLRLAQIFGDDHRVDLRNAPEGGTIATVEIPFRRHSTSATPLPAERVELIDAGGLQTVAADTAPVPPPRSAAEIRIPMAFQLVAGWTAVAVLWTELDSATRSVQGLPFDWNATMSSYALNALIWAALTPFVLAVARRLNLIERASSRVALHVACAAAAAVLHVGGWLLALRALRSPALIIAQRNATAWGVWDLVLYGTIVAFGTVATLGARHRETLVSMSSARAVLAQTRLASLRLRLQPALLLSALDSLSEAVRLDPERAEHAIARMGDLLRLLLATAERDHAPVGEELALLEAYLDVVDSAVPAASAHASRLPTGLMPREGRVGAVLLAPLVAAVGGGVVSVDVRQEQASLVFEFVTRNAKPRADDIQILRDRLAALYSGGATLTITPEAGVGLAVRLCMPLAAEEREIALGSRDPRLVPA